MKIIKSGTWFYDNIAEKPVDIVSLDYDFWYEMALEEDGLEPGEEPGPFGENGLIYYVRFRYAGETDQVHWVDSIGYPDLYQAINEAQRKTPSEIKWFHG